VLHARLLSCMRACVRGDLRCHSISTTVQGIADLLHRVRYIRPQKELSIRVKEIQESRRVRCIKAICSENGPCCSVSCALHEEAPPTHYHLRTHNLYTQGAPRFAFLFASATTAGTHTMATADITLYLRARGLARSPLRYTATGGNRVGLMQALLTLCEECGV
jgi:hypothetical protein